ncbi:flagellar basal-body MS-ring/collar protein FliF [Anaeromyxobacter paludicola]|uniref:Flagellar M-ring protein n=1 Tax=Anaeromyxobacter paludicola TaxID=2918171 RepID=A0ABM7X7Z8_9BACT|nr:flagellar basal-body MS-ring/collar protein FliF [Anaeromyxobacter paludicola]BDG07968.1 flagellar M-ring protein [Anaeromyxobacter paludicola]
MDQLLSSLRQLPQRFAALPGAFRALVIVGLAAAILGAVAYSVAQGETWQYAFTNLTAEDSGDAAALLKTAGVPYRLEAGGSALAVPAAKVYDARLLLAAQGLPRGGGVGFEIFDKGDLGVSEFTQKVNLRRAIEGELARTIGKLGSVRAARVHITLPEKGLFRDEDRKASAAVVLTLQPGRALEEREVAGIRHLTASAVPGLAPGSVSVIDGRGNVLSSEGAWGEADGFQRRVEHDLQQRVTELLEQAVGPGAVVARVTASVDASEVQTSAEKVDPDATALRNERHVLQSQSQSSATPGGVAGAAGNQPGAPAATATGQNGSSTMQDDVKNYDVSRTSTTTVTRAPRVKRISVAVLLDGVGGKPRPDAEVQRLGELAKRAVGFDAARGDELDISSSPFTRADEQAGAAAGAPAEAKRGVLLAGGAVAAAVVLAAVLLLALRKKGPAAPAFPPGATVAQLEAALAADAALMDAGAAGMPRLPDPASGMRDRAKALVTQDPAKAALILRAWIQNEGSNNARS